MGRSYWFECSKCGYRAKVSGGPDRGLHVHIQTIACRDCRQLYDAVTRFRIPLEPKMAAWNSLASWRKAPGGLQRYGNVPPRFETALNRLPYKGIPRLKWLSFHLQCPVSGLHRVESWNAPAKCPRCGLYLERTLLPYRIWE